ncbi:MAG: hypothetical protein C0624_05725 [Desulfuromonas sp.]|nr:MAG: hypothetical protein C0624_05725 [Desulfuromonas sp.]
MLNLLQIPLLGRLMRSRWSWRLLRCALLVLLLAMIAYGWHHRAIPGVELRDPLMYTSAATFGLWVLWMMGVVFVAALLGRGWCVACPVGWINGLVSRFGLQRPLPTWLRGFAPVTITLLILQLLAYLLAMHRFPDISSRLLAAMLLLAVAVGLLFRHRAFCSLFCPAGAVFGLYARIAPARLRVADAAICASCERESCVEGGEAWRRYSLGRGVFYWQARQDACPVDLKASDIGCEPDCTLCLNCVHNCPYDNLYLGRSAASAAPLGSSETLFFVVLIGLLTANFSKVYVDLRDALLWLPDAAARLLGWQDAGFYLLATPWLALLMPLLLMLPGLLVWRLSETRVESVTEAGETPPQPTTVDAPDTWARIGRLALPLLPTLLSAHLVLAVVKLNTKLGYLPLVLADPSGVRSYLALHVMRTLDQPSALLAIDLLKWLALALLLAGILWSVLLARSQARIFGRGYLLGALTTLATFSGLYLATVITWLFLR